MEEKVVLITGASGALGTALTEHFRKQKHIKLVLHFNANPILNINNENILLTQADLTQEHEVKAMMAKIEKKFGRLDMLINNAGISKSAISWKMSTEDFDATLNVNLKAPFLTSKYAIPLMRKNTWGRIVNISSVVAQTGFIGTTAYAASKAGLIGMTKTMSKELAAFNITVNALALGYFNRGMIDDVPDELRAEILKSVPMKQLGEPATIAKTLELLLSEEGSFITGQTLNLNGGLY